MIIDRPLCPDGRLALVETTTTPCAVQSRPYVLAAAILASAMGFIDGTVVTIALPAIERELSAPFETVQWVVNGYALTLGSIILLGGAAGDLYGRKRVFLTGIIFFSAASTACALASTISMLAVARILQGAGAALMVPQSLAIITASFPKPVRGRAIGIWAGASAITTAFGPPLGGILIDSLTWRAAFWINLPIACITIWLTLAHVPESRNETGAGKLDWLGGLLAVFAFGALTYGLIQAPAAGVFSVVVLTSFAAAVLGLVLFSQREHQAREPLLPPALLRIRAFVSTNVLTLFLYGSFSAVLFLLPFDLIARRGFSASEAGLALLPVGLIIGLGSRTAGRWGDTAGPRPPLVIGSAIVAFGAALLAAGLSDVWLGVVAPVTFMAAGMAIVVAPLTAAVMNAVPEDQSGIASGVNNAASRLAGLISVVIVGSVAAAVYAGQAASSGFGNKAELRFGILPGNSLPTRAALEAAFLTAYQTGLVIAAILAGLAALTGALFVGGSGKE